MTWTHDGFLYFSVNSTSKTVTTNGKTLTSKLYFGNYGTGDTYTLQDNITTTAATNGCELGGGTLDLNGKTLTTPVFKINDATNARTLTFGAGTIVCTGSGSVFQADATNLTVNANTGTIKFTDTTSTDKTFQGVGKTWGTIWNATTSTGRLIITGANTFAGIKSDVGRYWTFPASTTTTLSTASGWNMTGSAGNLIDIISSSGGTAATLSCTTGKVSSNYLSLKDSTATGGAVFFAGANSTNVSGNTGWLFETSLYDKTISSAGGNSNANTAWVEGSVPSATDNVGTYSGSGNLTINAALSCRSFDMNGYAGTVTHNSGVTMTIGDATTGTGDRALRLVSGMTYTLGSATTSAISFTSTSGTTQTITTGTKTLGNTTINGVGGTFQLQDALTLGSGATLTLTNGTFDANNQNLSMGLFSSSNSNTRVLTMGSGTWTLTGNAGTIWTTATSTNLTINANTSTIDCTYSGSTGTRTAVVSVAVNHFKVSAGTDTFTWTTGFLVNNLDYTGFAGTWSGSTNCTISGSLTISTGLTRTYTGGITFNATSGTKSITSNGKALASAITLNGVGGTWQLADAFNTNSTFTLTNGTFDTNAKTISSSTFSSNNTNTRVLTFSSSTWTLTGNAATIFNLNTAGTGLTLNLGGTWDCNYSGSTGTRTIAGSTATTARMGNLKISAGTDTVSFTQGVTCVNLDFTGFSGTWSGSVALNLTGNLVVSATIASLTFSGAMTWAHTSGTATITSNGKTLVSGITMNGVGGTLQLADALTTGTNNKTLTLTNGTFDDGGFNLTMAAFSSSNSNTRVINTGACTWTLNGAAVTLWTTATSTGLTLNLNSSWIMSLTDVSGGGTRTVTCNNVQVNHINVPGGDGSSTITLTNVNCNNLNFTGFAGTWSNSTITVRGNLTMGSGMLASGGTLAITMAATSGTKTITSNGYSIDRPITFNGVGGTWQLIDAINLSSTNVNNAMTLTNGSFDANNQNIRIGRFSSSNSNTRSISMGSGTWTLSGDANTLWDTSTSTNLTVTPSTSIIDCNSSVSAGTRGINTSSSTSARIGTLKVTAGTDTLSINLLTCSGLDFTGFAGTWSGVGALNTTGNVVVSTGLTRTYTGGMTFANTSGTKTFTSNGKAFASSLTMDGVGGTMQFADAYSSTSSLNLTNGTMNDGGNNITVATFGSNNSNTRTLTMGATTWTITGTSTAWNITTSTGMTLNRGTSTIKMTESGGVALEFAGGGLTYYNLWFAPGSGTADRTVKGSNTFNDLKDDGTIAHRLRFDNSSTNTFTTFTVSGNSGQLITIKSVSDGSTHTLTKSGGGTISCNYITPTDSIATPETTWYSLLTNGCTNGGNNTGWVFSSYSTSPSMFMIF